MPVLVEDISGDLEKDVDFSTLETALRDTIGFMLKSYHAPLIWPIDRSVVGEIERSDVRRTLENVVIEAPVELPGFNVSIYFNERYAPEDSMTFDFLKIKMKDGNAVPLERLYEILGRREIVFQPEKEIGTVDTFDYNHLMDCLFNLHWMPDMKVKRSGSRMFVWRPEKVTTESYVISTDRYHHLVPEHLRNSIPVQVSEGWSAVKLAPKFQSDGRQQRVVSLSVSDEQGVKIGNANAVRFYVANYAGFTQERCGFGEGGMIVHTGRNSKSHFNVDRFIPIEARNAFFYKQDGRMFPVYDELVVPLPRFWRMTDSRYEDHTMNQFERIIDYLCETLTYILVSPQDELAQSQVHYASLAYGFEDMNRTPLVTIAERIKPKSPKEVVSEMADKHRAEITVSLESTITTPESSGISDSFLFDRASKSGKLVFQEPTTTSLPVSIPEEKVEPTSGQSIEEVVTKEVVIRHSRTPWYFTGIATLAALVVGGYALLKPLKMVYVKESVPIEIPVVSSPIVTQQEDDQGRYMVVTNNAPLRDTLDSVLKNGDGTFQPFSGRTLGDVDVSELTIRASNGNFLLDRGYESDDGNYYVGLIQVSDKNPRRMGNPGKTVWENSTFSNALMLTNWYKSPNTEEEALVIYRKIAEVLHLTFPGQGYTADNLEIRGENLEVYVKNRTRSMINVGIVSNRVQLYKDDIIIIPIADIVQSN